MARTQNFNNTDETFLLASLREFVNIWVSDTQARPEFLFSSTPSPQVGDLLLAAAVALIPRVHTEHVLIVGNGVQLIPHTGPANLVPYCSAFQTLQCYWLFCSHLPVILLTFYESRCGRNQSDYGQWGNFTRSLGEYLRISGSSGQLSWSEYLLCSLFHSCFFHLPWWII